MLDLLGYFWGPIPWMIEVAALLSAVVQHWADLAIILVLLVFNAAVGFWQEYQAGNAVEQLKKKLALKARVRRDGCWILVEARDLVPGDIVRVRLGDVIPADLTLIEGDFLSIDQSALTGESLPVEKGLGEQAYSGAVVKQGEMIGAVTATGMQTYFCEEDSARLRRVVDDLAAKGYRTLGVARSEDGQSWMLLGILPLFDPPREDAAETLA